LNHRKNSPRSARGVVGVDHAEPVLVVHSRTRPQSFWTFACYATFGQPTTRPFADPFGYHSWLRHRGVAFTIIAAMK
jgi:hypothetical protein